MLTQSLASSHGQYYIGVGIIISFIQAGGCKAGTFDPYPKHSDDPYGAVKSRKDDSPSKLKGGVFRPSPGPKSTRTASIVQQNVTR